MAVYAVAPSNSHHVCCSDSQWSRPALQDFSEWAQCQVLEFVSQYRPAGEQEIYDFMNALDDRLAHSNSAVVMATVKVFLHFTLSLPATHQQVGLPYADCPQEHMPSAGCMLKQHLALGWEWQVSATPRVRLPWQVCTPRQAQCWRIA